MEVPQRPDPHPQIMALCQSIFPEMTTGLRMGSWWLDQAGNSARKTTKHLRHYLSLLSADAELVGVNLETFEAPLSQ